MPSRVSPSSLVVDIETIPDPELVTTPPAEGGPLPPPVCHQIVAIGVCWLDDRCKLQRIGLVGSGKPEAAMLADFARFLDEREPRLVTWNGRGFDLPVIAARCFRHGVPFRHYYERRELRYRFSCDGHFDLMDYMADFGAARPAKLDVAARAAGMPGKLGVDGSDVARLVAAGRLADVQRYCVTDVVQTTAVYLRLELVRGALDPDAYRRAMHRLLSAAEGDPRCDELVAALDRDRLLLGEPAFDATPAPPLVYVAFAAAAAT
ncbi:MAG TPA: ribonuclease H-like domain-containing protein [Polyangiaceae bacterium]|nr:ribonuclease H-like domain-containing protein [Polyangiaceae bacterium]